MFHNYLFHIKCFCYLTLVYTFGYISAVKVLRIYFQIFSNFYNLYNVKAIFKNKTDKNEYYLKFMHTLFLTFSVPLHACPKDIYQ